MALIDWTRNQADEIVRCAQRWVKRLDERGRRQVPNPPQARNHKKRHSVNRERSFEQRAKALATKKRVAENLERRQKIKAVMRAYYAGEVADLSGLPE